jgi:hypothetical protein
VYRFYHQSFKVYHLQDLTAEVADKLRSLAPGRPLNSWFEQILKEGTGREFKPDDNENWLAVARPMLEAFFHSLRVRDREQAEDVTQAIRARFVRCLSSPSPERRDGTVGGAGVRNVWTGGYEWLGASGTGAGAA